MKLQIFAVRDVKTAHYANPMFLISKGEAIRSFSDAVNQEDKTSLLYKHPEDFELYQLGEYDSDTGLFTTHTPTQIVTAHELKITKT